MVTRSTPQSDPAVTFRCAHEGITFECTAQRAAGREVRDYKVHVQDVDHPETLYSFDLIMVRTPPRYTVNSIKINTVPLPASGSDTNVNTKFIWLPRDCIPEEPEFAFARTIDRLVKHIKEHEAPNAKSA
jgi:hypothetical protein